MNENYERDGYVIARGVVGEAWVAAGLQHARETLARFPDESPERLHRRPLWREDGFYHRFVAQPALLDLAEAILGPDLALFATGYIVKPPANDLAVLWHQDGSYWPLEPMEVCTLWVALTPSTIENGCMRVIPGTQHLELQKLRMRTDVKNLLDSEMERAPFDESSAVDLELFPGDVSIHHPNIVHGSHPNASPDQWRINLVVRVIAASTRVTAPDWGVYPLRGARRDDMNLYLDPPKETEWNTVSST